MRRKRNNLWRELDYDTRLRLALVVFSAHPASVAPCGFPKWGACVAKSARFLGMSKLVFGSGYLGERVAQYWLAAGEEVYVVTRSPERAQRWQAVGFRPLVADVTEPATLRGLPAVETVLFAVGFDRSAGKPIHSVYVDGLANALAACVHGQPHWIYISSTGVYGQVEGQWVDEDSPCQPTREGGIACLAAEQLLLGSEAAPRATVLRLAGIYGPGRIPRVADIKAGQPIAAPSDGYVNLIHVKDAAQIVVNAAACQPHQRLYVVSDGHPVLRRDYYAELARLVGAPPPQFAPPDAAAHATQRAGSDKRVRPDRLYQDMPMQLQYPSYREGLAAIVAGEA